MFDKKKKEKKQKDQPPKKKRTAAESASNYACPMLLGGVLCFTIYYALYRPYAPLMTAVFLMMQLLLFSFFDMIKTKKLLGGIIYCVLLFIIVNGALMIMWSGVGNDYMEPVSWFYGEDGSYSYRPEFIWAVFIGGGFFLISVMYYFTQIRYRSLGVMLCILFPFVIYAKRAEEMPEIIVTLIITLYLALMVHNRRIDPAVSEDLRGRLKIDKSYLISIAIFVSVTGAATMMIKKPTYRSKLEQDSNFFNYVDTNATGNGENDDISEQSSQRSGPPSYTGAPMFYFETDGSSTQYFLRVQSFDDFDGDRWQYSFTDSDFARVYSTIIPEYGTDDILADMRALGLQGSADLPNRAKGHVFDEDFSPEFLPAPLGTVTDTTPFEGLTYYKFPKAMIIRSAARNADSNPVLDDRFEFFEQDHEFYAYAAELGLNSADYCNMLEANSSNEAAARLLADYQEACENYTAMSGVSDRVALLAHEITKNAGSDFEKAKLLETYFEERGFEYSLDYVPPDESIDYFIFNSRTGYCTNFATAMTLMARAAGLPARYTEGYVAFERASDGSYVLRDSYAHAFVEVYISGAGWMTFDPTVAGYMQIPEEDNSFNAAAFFRILSRFLVVIIVAFVIIFVMLLDRIVELVLRIRLRFMSADKRTLMLYRNVIKLVNYSSGSDHSAYTVKMLRSYLYEKRTVAPEKLFVLFERTAFGGMTPTEEEYAEAYAEYRQCYKYLRKVPRPKTLAKLRARA